jgi:hypothetical protein
MGSSDGNCDTVKRAATSNGACWGHAGLLDWIGAEENAVYALRLPFSTSTFTGRLFFSLIDPFGQKGTQL